MKVSLLFLVISVAIYCKCAIADALFEELSSTSQHYFASYENRVVSKKEYERALSYLVSLNPHFYNSSVDPATLDRICKENPSPYTSSHVLTASKNEPIKGFRDKCANLDERKALAKAFLEAYAGVPPVPNKKDRYLPQYALKIKRWGRDGSNCPKERWLEVWAEYSVLRDTVHMYEQMQSSKRHRKHHGYKEGFFFINAGFNKGYNFASWLHMFAPWSNISAQSWHRSLVKSRQAVPKDGKLVEHRTANIDNSMHEVVFDEVEKLMCGWVACADCLMEYALREEVARLPMSPRRTISMLGIDLNQGNLALVRDAVKDLKNSVASSFNNVNLHTLHAAVGGEDGELNLPVCPVADEECSVSKLTEIQRELTVIKHENLTYRKVPLLRMDTLLRKYAESVAKQHASHFYNRSHILRQDTLNALNNDSVANVYKNSDEDGIEQGLIGEFDPTNAAELRDAVGKLLAKRAVIQTGATRASARATVRPLIGSNVLLARGKRRSLIYSINALGHRLPSVQTDSGKGIKLSPETAKVSQTIMDSMDYSGPNARSQSSSAAGHRSMNRHRSRAPVNLGPDRRGHQDAVVDILMIDTEGNDPQVLQGARELLRGHQVRVVLFEYHRTGQWETQKLGPVISQLDADGYCCYWQGQERLWPITGCWDDLYEFHNWSNVLCVLNEVSIVLFSV